MTTLAVGRDVGAGSALLTGTLANQAAAADIFDESELPAGFGDCLVLRCAVRVGPVTTSIGNPELRGPEFGMSTPGGVRSDVFGAARWVLVLAAGGAIYYTAFVEPLRPVLWRAPERLAMTVRNPETTLAATDFELYVTVGRLRNLGT